MRKKTEQITELTPDVINKMIQQKQFIDAEKLIKLGLKQAPHHALLHYYLGRVYYESNRFDLAIKELKIASQEMPDYQNIYLMLFNIYSAKNDLENAIVNIEKALQLNKQNTELQIQYLYYLYLNKLHQKAFTYLKQIEPNIKNNKVFYNMVGLLYRDVGDFENATTYFNKSIALDPNYFEVFNNMAFIYLQTGQHSDAIQILKKCLALSPNFVDAYVAITNHYLALSQLASALESIQTAFELAPNNHDVVALNLQVARYACDWVKVEELTPMLDKIIHKCLNQNVLVPERPWLNVTRTQDNQQNFLVAKNSTDCYLNPRIAEYKTSFKFNRPANKKIKIGYFSNDFYDHPTMHLVGNLFKYHNRDLFEIHLFSYGPIKENDPYFDLAKNSADYFYDLAENGFLKTSEFIYQKNIDVLVDLKGYTTGSKLEVSALKPAPILLQYLGYPGTMGNDKYDYIITDNIVTPLDDEKYYSEKFVYLPYTYQVTDNQQIIADKVYTRKDFDLPEDVIILSTFNNSFKIEKECFVTWLDILKKYDNTILWIYEPNDFIKKHLTEFAKRYNNTEERIYFAPKLKKEAHLSRIKLVDLMLDTFTCNGHTTTTDALWSGVPVITLKGKHFASRVSASILTAMKLPELITESKQDYVEKISHYCKNPNELEKLKQKIADNRLTTPLFQSEAFASYLDKAYLEIYKRYQDGKTPEHLTIDLTS